MKLTGFMKRFDALPHLKWLEVYLLLARNKGDEAIAALEAAEEACVDQPSLNLDGTTDGEPDGAAEERVRFFADTLEIEPSARLLSEDGAPAPELMAFCKRTGMSLDWAFLGDLRPMVRATYWGRKDAR